MGDLIELFHGLGHPGQDGGQVLGVPAHGDVQLGGEDRGVVEPVPHRILDLDQARQNLVGAHDLAVDGRELEVAVQDLRGRDEIGQVLVALVQDGGGRGQVLGGVAE